MRIGAHESTAQQRSWLDTRFGSRLVRATWSNGERELPGTTSRRVRCALARAPTHAVRVVARSVWPGERTREKLGVTLAPPGLG